jgi:hypothetical protein
VYLVLTKDVSGLVLRAVAQRAEVFPLIGNRKLVPAEFLRGLTEENFPLDGALVLRGKALARPELMERWKIPDERLV